MEGASLPARRSERGVPGLHPGAGRGGGVRARERVRGRRLFGCRPHGAAFHLQLQRRQVGDGSQLHPPQREGRADLQGRLQRGHRRGLALPGRPPGRRRHPPQRGPEERGLRIYRGGDGGHPGLRLRHQGHRVREGDRRARILPYRRPDRPRPGGPRPLPGGARGSGRHGLGGGHLRGHPEGKRVRRRGVRQLRLDSPDGQELHLRVDSPHRQHQRRLQGLRRAAVRDQALRGVRPLPEHRALRAPGCQHRHAAPVEGLRGHRGGYRGKGGDRAGVRGRYPSLRDARVGLVHRALRRELGRSPALGDAPGQRGEDKLVIPHIGRHGEGGGRQGLGVRGHA